MTKDAMATIGRFFATIDTIVMGRKTLDTVIAMTGSSYKSPNGIPTFFRWRKSQHVNSRVS